MSNIFLFINNFAICCKKPSNKEKMIVKKPSKNEIYNLLMHIYFISLITTNLQIYYIMKSVELLEKG